MLLNKLIEPLMVSSRSGDGNPDVTSLVYDSRHVVQGSLFICVKGGKFDGHEFIDDAIDKGACAIVGDTPERFYGLKSKIPIIVIPDTRPALPVLANQFFDHPSRRLKLVGITGTKGKTTTTYLIESILTHAGLGAGVIGTMGTRIMGQAIPGDRTTPESVDLQGLFSQMLDKGVSAAAMEVSSHALAMGRTEGTEFDVGVFTNLTRDHLDFHKTLGDYLQTKLRLFDKYPDSSSKPFTAVINVDDPAGERVRQVAHGGILTYGIKSRADIVAENVSACAHGVSFDVNSPAGSFHVDLNLGGNFNVYNSLAAIGSALALGLDVRDIKAGLESVKSVDGRFEAVDCGQDFSVLVDYAHTPDSLENVLRSARELTSKRLIVVFGCGGDRDRGKRPMMGTIGADMADICIVTSDNPRSEAPEVIIDEILAGTTGRRAKMESIIDRRAAIEHSLKIARKGDLVVIAGKGHETYQIFRDRTVHFDDREVVREVLACIRNG